MLLDKVCNCFVAAPESYDEILGFNEFGVLQSRGNHAVSDHCVVGVIGDVSIRDVLAVPMGGAIELLGSHKQCHSFAHLEVGNNVKLLLYKTVR